MRYLKRIVGIFAAVCIALFSAVQTAFAAESADSSWEEKAWECIEALTGADNAEKFWAQSEAGEFSWAAYCCARLCGSDGAGDYAASLEKSAKELYSGGGFVTPTEYQRTALCISATGGSADFAVRCGAYECETLSKQGFNAYIWALIAINVTQTQAPENAVNTAESLVEYITAAQHSDGSFSLTGDTGDVDITAAAVYALCGAKLDGASRAAQAGADWLAECDSYSSMGVRNCESTAQAVIALCAAGRTDAALNAAAQLEEYRREGGYAHLPDGDVNQIATVQALEAFTALALSERGESLFGAMPAAKPAAEQTSEATAEIAAESTGGLSGTQIRIILSVILGTAATVCIALFVLRRKKALVPSAAALAVLAAGVWVLDIRSPEEYYAQADGGPVSVTVSASCSAVLDNMDMIEEDVNPAEVIPDDGVIIAECEVALPEGATAFDALVTAAREQKVRVDYSGTSYGAYVRSIGYVCEFGFGELSGWMYKVNGSFPGASASAAALDSGDVVEFVYTCSLGGDVGNYYMPES